MISDQPQIEVARSHYNVKFKSSITLSCTIKANPEVRLIRWIKCKDGKQHLIDFSTSNSSKYSGKNTNHFTITHADDDDAGEYICEAFNVEGGGLSDSITLTVLGGTIFEVFFSNNMGIIKLARHCISVI